MEGVVLISGQSKTARLIGGRLYVGVQDDGTVIGLEHPDEVITSHSPYNFFAKPIP